MRKQQSPETGDPQEPPLTAEQKRLVAEHAEYCEALVRQVAGQKSLPKGVELADVIANAHMELMKLARRFRAGEGVQFKTYVYRRIKCSVYDYLRSNGRWFGRKSRQERLAQDELADVLDKPDATSVEEAEARVEESIRRVMTVVLMSQLDNPVDAAGGESPDEIAEREEQRAIDESMILRLREAVAALEPVQQQYVRMVFFEGLSYQEVAEKVKKNKGSVFRICRGALEALKHELIRAAT